MDKYNVKILPQAKESIEEIYKYISMNLKSSAISIISNIEKAILSCEHFPHKHEVIRSGKYKGEQYRRVYAKNFTVIYRVLEEEKTVYIVNVLYSKSNI